MKRINIIPVIVLPFLCCCSVKEDRDDCPCWLQIDLSTCSYYADYVSIKGWTDLKSVFGVRILKEDFTSDHEEEVPRTMIHYCASSGLEASMNSGMSVVIPVGFPSDRLYAYRADVPAYGETAYDRVSLHKQYADVLVRIDDRNDYHLVVKGGWNGLSLNDLSPVAGPFTCIPEKTSENVWYFRLPRQGDDSLVMEITGENGYTFPFDLGGLIEESGYDWDAEDLDDIMLGINYMTGGVSVSVIPWEEGIPYDEII